MSILNTYMRAMYKNLFQRNTMKMAALFEGQGAQFVGMGKELFDQYSYVKELFREASDTLKMDMCKLCFEDPEQKLHLTEYTQPALMTVEAAAYLVLTREFNWKPYYLAGHSLGEITGLVCGGAISFANGVALVRARGKYMQEAVQKGKGTMLAVCNCSPVFLKDLCQNVNENRTHACIANYNSNNQYVLSGETEVIEYISQELNKRDIWNKRLNVSAPFHNPLMISAAERLEEDLEKVEIQDLEIPVLSNVTGLPYCKKEMVKEHILKQLVSPVEWVKCMDFLRWNGVFHMIDMGPGKVLKNLAKDIAQVKVDSLDEGRTFLLKQQNDKKEDSAINFIKECVRIAVGTPNYREDNDSLSSVTLLQEMKSFVLSLSDQNRSPERVDVERAYEMLQKVLNEKHVPEDEREFRLNSLKCNYNLIWSKR